MALIERRPVGKDRLVLTVDPTAQAKRVKKCRHVTDARLWELPYGAILQRLRLPDERIRWRLIAMQPFMAPIGDMPVLSKGRVLHLKGKFDESPAAAEFYQMARIPDRELYGTNFNPGFRPVYQDAKRSASYWLGLVAAELQNYRAALDYFEERVLLDAPGGPWTHGASYNAGRVYEENGDPQKAIDYYMGDAASPAYHGNILRARWLAALVSGQPARPAGGAVAEPGAKEPILPPMEAPKETEKPVLPGLDLPMEGSEN
jgi:hypothetical protein